jgi:hypothetical protein
MPSYIKSNEASRFWTITFGEKITYRCGYRGSGTYPLNSSQNIEGYDICVILGYGPSDVKNGKKNVLFENPQARVNIVKNKDPIEKVRFRP